MKIWKYPLEVSDAQRVNMPAGAKLLCIQVQRGVPMLWALVNSENEVEPRFLLTVGTGHRCPGGLGSYVGTYQIDSGFLVFHVFEECK